MKARPGAAAGSSTLGHYSSPSSSSSTSLQKQLHSSQRLQHPPSSPSSPRTKSVLISCGETFLSTSSSYIPSPTERRRKPSHYIPGGSLSESKKLPPGKNNAELLVEEEGGGVGGQSTQSRGRERREELVTRAPKQPEQQQRRRPWVEPIARSQGGAASSNIAPIASLSSSSSLPSPSSSIDSLPPKSAKPSYSISLWASELDFITPQEKAKIKVKEERRQAAIAIARAYRAHRARGFRIKLRGALAVARRAHAIIRRAWEAYREVTLT